MSKSICSCNFDRYCQISLPDQLLKLTVEYCLPVKAIYFLFLLQKINYFVVEFLPIYVSMALVYILLMGNGEYYSICLQVIYIMCVSVWTIQSYTSSCLITLFSYWFVWVLYIVRKLAIVCNMSWQLQMFSVCHFSFDFVYGSFAEQKIRV